MAVHGSVPRMSYHESERRRRQLRREQQVRQEHRRKQLHKVQFHEDLFNGVRGVVVLAAIVVFFALVYLLAVSDFVPSAY